MPFNHDKTKEAQEVLFSRKTKLFTHALLFFNKFNVKLASSQKHLGLDLDCNLSFNREITDKINKMMKGIGPRLSLLTMYKSFIQHHHDYRDLVNDAIIHD